jgi:hypothetical protein
MNTFVRVVGIILIVVGAVVMVISIFGGFAAVIRVGAQTAGFAFPGGRGFIRPATPINVAGLGLLLAVGVFVQGLVTAALGGGLYLLADIDRSLRGRPQGIPASVPQAPAAPVTPNTQATPTPPQS